MSDEETKVEEIAEEVSEPAPMAKEEIGITEINEVFDGLDVLADFAGRVLADGKVSVTDLNSLVHLASKFSTLGAAVEGADKAVKEGKNLDQAEVIAILGRVYSVVSKFSQAKKA